MKESRTDANQAEEVGVEGTASRPEQSEFTMDDCISKGHFELAPEISRNRTVAKGGCCGQGFVRTRTQAAEIYACWSRKGWDWEIIKKGVAT